MSKLYIPESEQAKFNRWVNKLSDKNSIESQRLVVSTALNIQRWAMMFAPVDFGLLRSSIRTKFIKGQSGASIYTVRKYAPYVEFGTGKYASSFVNTLESDLKKYASNFKGVKKVTGSRAQPYLFPAWRLGVKEMKEKLKRMGFNERSNR